MEWGETESTDWVRTDHLFFKRRKKEPEKAGQEHQAVQIARSVLPPELAPPQTFGIFGEWLVSEVVQGSNLHDHSSLSNCQSAARYLARLHSIPLNEEIKKKLRDLRMTHYSGLDLKSRIEQEANKSNLAFPDSTDAAQLRNVVNEIIHDVYDLDDPSVLGHGDFQTKNVFVRDAKVIAVDWTDFGLCCRAYEVAHFLHSISPDNRVATAGAYFGDALGGPTREWLLHGGDVIDAIIRAGSVTRSVCDLGVPIDEQLRQRFRTQVDRAKTALEAFYVTG